MSPKEIESQLAQLLREEQKREEVIRNCATFVLNNGGSWEDAKEIFSQAVFSVLSKVKNNELTISGGNLPAYFNGACRNLWLNRLRQNKRAQFITNPEGKEIDIESPDTNPSEKIELEIQYQRMEACIEEMNERCKKNTEQLLLGKKILQGNCRND